MDVNFILPLEQQVLVIIADTLWNSQCMDKLVFNCSKRIYLTCYDAMQDREEEETDVEKDVDQMMGNVLTGKISKLFLPQTIKDKLVWVARNVGVQKINYYFYHEYLWNVRELPKSYHWTSRGSIDKRKTAKTLINDGTIAIGDRYSLACYYCFEKEIRKLNEELSPRAKSRLFDCDNELITYWNRTIRKSKKRKHNQTIKAMNKNADDNLWDDDEDPVSYKQAYKDSVRAGNRVAAEYFWSKLTVEEYSLQEREHDRPKFLKEMLLKHYHGCYGFRPKENFLDVALFLLKQMTKDQQMEALAAKPHLTLDLFLDWPLLRLFFEAAEMFCPHASARNLSDILCSILKRIMDNHKGFDYREVFTGFWRFLSVSQKANVMDRFIKGSSTLFRDMLAVEYLKGIFLIVHDATATQKEDFIHSVDGVRICETLAFREKWELLKLFIDMCLPSTNLNLRCKKWILKCFLAEEKNE